MAKNKAPYVSKAVENPDQPNSMKWFNYKPKGKVLVFGLQPEMPWHKLCKCGHGERSHKPAGCIECDCKGFWEVKDAVQVKKATGVDAHQPPEDS